MGEKLVKPGLLEAGMMPVAQEGERKDGEFVHFQTLPKCREMTK
jgi:hypothetical protein